MEKWFIKNKLGDISRIAKENNISLPLAKILINRGMNNQEDIDIFLNSDLNSLHNPLLLHDMEAAGRLIKKKITTGKKILIVGDYDVDGIMSTYILYSALKKLGANVNYTIPDRIQDGYGINKQIVLNAKAQAVDTIITCDNGISAFEPIKIGKNMGMTIIITDHHDIPYVEKEGILTELMPEADCIINPKKSICNYPEKNLCGAGISYKLVDYLKKIHKNRINIDHLLDMVAIATICDVVDLVGENRIFVKEGLSRLNNTSNLGLRTLFTEVGLDNKEISVYHIGFIIGPNLNASGRLDSALLGLRLLLSEDKKTAIKCANKLIELNEERKNLTIKGTEIIEKIVEEKHINDKVLVAYSPEIHESVAGIIAGRVKDKYNRPTIVLTKMEGGVKGSGRSIEDYHINEELSNCKNLLMKFGGHPMACGLSLKEENINKLRECLNKNTVLEKENLAKKVYMDMVMPLEKINYEFIEDIKLLEPFGKANPKPTFGYKGLNLLKASVLGDGRNVVKIKFDNSNTRFNEAIIFCNGDEWLEEVENFYGYKELNKLLLGLQNDVLMDIIYNPSINEYMGRNSIQFIINNYRFDRIR